MGKIRLTLAFIVIAFHTGFPLLGPFAIIVFYIFSGYVITYGLVNGGLQNGFVNYAKKRTKRIAPTLIIVSALQIAFLFLVSKLFDSQIMILFKNFKEFNYDNLLSYYNLLNFEIFYQPFPPLLSFQYLLIPSSWSIFNEIIYYFVIFIFLKATMKSEKLRFFLLILTLIIIQVIGVSSAQQDLGLLNKYVYFNSITGFSYFLIGSSLCLSKKQNSNFRRSRYIFGPFLILILCTFTLVFGGPEWIFPKIPVYSWIMFSYFVSILSVITIATLSKVRSKFDIFCGYHSYGVYIYAALFFLLIEFSKISLVNFGFESLGKLESLVFVSFASLFSSILQEYLLGYKWRNLFTKLLKSH
jgi:peptidoglycan/LPS O-acetylase OafA/YrhL